MIVGDVYRLPRVLNCDYKQFIDEFASVLCQTDFVKSEVLLQVLNINLLKINEKEYCS